MEWVLSPILFETNESVEDAIDTDRTRKRNRRLVCAQCGAPITWDRARIEMRGGHEHSFFNPHGVVYRIGCFREAPGCRHVGPSSKEFTWFPGYRWRIVYCGQCTAHLGWSFSADSAFFGLILNRLIVAEHDKA